MPAQDMAAELPLAEPLCTAAAADAAPLPRPALQQYQRGIPATCERCGIVGHRTLLCVSHLLPDVIVHTTARRKSRLLAYFTSSPLYAPLSLTAVDTEREPQLIFLRTPHPSALLHTAQRDSLINRHFFAVFTSRDTTRHEQRLLLPFAAAPPGSVQAVRVQCWPKAVSDDVLRVLTAGGVQTDRRVFSHVLFVVFAYSRFHSALETAEHHYAHIHQRLDANIPSAASAAVSPALPASSPVVVTNGCSPSFSAVVSRAYYKLKEVVALEPWLLSTPQQQRAVDIGSAPGGWTSFLANAGCDRVLSVDPGELLTAAHPRVVHVRKRIEECDAELRQHGPFHLVTCDMNCYSFVAVRCLLSLLPHLLPGAGLVLTVKELQAGSARRLQADAMELLAVGFHSLRTHFLLSNGRERTVVGVRRDRQREEEQREVAALLQRIELMERQQEEAVKVKVERRRSGLTAGGKLGRRHDRNVRRQQQAEAGGADDDGTAADEPQISIACSEPAEPDSC